jgi:hypothetical protein
MIAFEEATECAFSSEGKCELEDLSDVNLLFINEKVELKLDFAFD